jgi:hypothetical protein
VLNLRGWVAQNAATNPQIAAAADLYRSGKWDGESIRTLQITIAARKLWATHTAVLQAVVSGYSAQRAKAQYRYTLLVPDDDEPIDIARPHLYSVGDTIEMCWVSYRVIGGRCTLDCGPYSQFVLDCELIHSTH